MTWGTEESSHPADICPHGGALTVGVYDGSADRNECVLCDDGASGPMLHRASGPRSEAARRWFRYGPRSRA